MSCLTLVLFAYFVAFGLFLRGFRWFGFCVGISGFLDSEVFLEPEIFSSLSGFASGFRHLIPGAFGLLWISLAAWVLRYYVGLV